MIQEYQIRILPEQAASEEGIKRYLAKEKGLDVRTLNQVRVLKRSIDARQRTIFVNLKVRAYINEFPQDDQYVHTEYPDVSSRPRVIVVGEGPGGLFASLRLIELGYRPIVLERGKDVRERKKDLSNITKTQKVDGESNYCFGEGGAGAYSDGKLYTRSKKRGSVDKILNVFCQHGANTNILADAHPHIGTDKLPHATKSTLRSKAKKPSLNFPVFLYFIILGIRLLLFQILSTHLCTSFSVYTSRYDSTCIASTFTAWEESLDADMLQGFAVTDDADRR
jgi:uncharacterized protein